MGCSSSGVASTTPQGWTGSIRRTATALLIAGVLPLPAPLATDAPVGAWGLWGVGYIAAALVCAFAGTLRDTRAAQDAAAAGRMP